MGSSRRRRRAYSAWQEGAGQPRTPQCEQHSVGGRGTFVPWKGFSDDEDEEKLPKILWADLSAHDDDDDDMGPWSSNWRGANAGMLTMEAASEKSPVETAMAVECMSEFIVEGLSHSPAEFCNTCQDNGKLSSHDGCSIFDCIEQSNLHIGDVVTKLAFSRSAKFECLPDFLVEGLSQSPAEYSITCQDFGKVLSHGGSSNFDDCVETLKLVQKRVQENQPTNQEHITHVPQTVEQTVPFPKVVHVPHEREDLVLGPQVQHQECIVQNPVEIAVQIPTPQVIEKTIEAPKIVFQKSFDDSFEKPKIAQKTVQTKQPINQEHITHVPQTVGQTVPVPKVLHVPNEREELVLVPQKQHQESNVQNPVAFGVQMKKPINQEHFTHVPQTVGQTVPVPKDVHVPHEREELVLVPQTQH